MSAFSADLAVILPELLLAVMGMVLLLWGAFRGNRDFGVITVAAALLMFAAAALAIVAPTGNGFNSLFVNDAFARFSKVVIFAGSGVATLMALTFSADTFRRFEMPVLMVYAATGLSVMVSSGPDDRLSGDRAFVAVLRSRLCAGITCARLRPG